MSKVKPDSTIFIPRRVHLLVDPDKWELKELERLLRSHGLPEIVGSIIVGGSFLHTSHLEEVMDVCICCGVPVGNIVSASSAEAMISRRANYLLLPILFGSRDTRFVLDHIIRAVPTIERYGVPCVAYAYLTLDTGAPTAAQFFTQAVPIPRSKGEILRTLSLAAEYMGLSGVYLEAGSNAATSPQPAEVRSVTNACCLPVIVGGGINTARKCRELFKAGATSIVIGSAVEARRNLAWLQGI
jgi:phosphoglycerol geranylgeranyltransferase